MLEEGEGGRKKKKAASVSQRIQRFLVNLPPEQKIVFFFSM